jgi:hypothetical protein
VRSSANADNQKALEEQFNRSGGPSRPGELDRFRDSAIVRAVQNGGPDSEFRVLNIHRCIYREGGHWVELLVEIKTPETVVRFPFTVRSQDLPGEGRKWYVDWTKVPPVIDDSMGIWTEDGKKINVLRQLAARFAGQWAQKLQAGKVEDVLEMTADKNAFQRGGTGIDTSLLWIPDDRERLRKELDKLFDKKATNRLRIVSVEVPNPEKPLAFFERDKKTKRIRIILEFRLGLIKPDAKEGAPTPLFLCNSHLTVERTDSTELTVTDPDSLKWKVLGLKVFNFRTSPYQMGGMGPARPGFGGEAP